MQNRIFFVTTAINKKIGSALILEGRSVNSKQTYFYFGLRYLQVVFKFFFHFRR